MKLRGWGRNGCWRATLFVALIATGLTSAQSTAEGTASASPPTAWQLLDDGDPTDGAFPMAYDLVRRREILLINAADYWTVPGSARPPSMWELVGEDWVRRFIPEPTPWLTNSCMAFDSNRGKAVLFGGHGNDETWEYDGTAWTKRTLAVRPPPRFHCGMVFDASRNVIVMFGGEDDSTNAFGDTWEYDGVQWTQRTFSTSPGARSEISLSYDSDRHVTVLFGGRIPFGSVFRDTWEYSGTKWTYKNKYEVYNPPARAAATMAYDPVHQRTYLYGGYIPAGVFGDTWAWDGTRWTQQSPLQSPQARRGMSLVWDTQRQAIVGFGGEFDNGSANETWRFDGATWTRIAASSNPLPRSSLGMTYDPTLDALVLYGGENANDWTGGLYYTDTWLRENSAWTQDSGAGRTTTSASTPLVFDRNRGIVRGFGGQGYGGTSNAPPDVHAFDNTTLSWSSTTVGKPDGRVEHPIAFASDLGGLAVFAGWACCFTGGFYVADDTWFYDGTTFVQRAPPHSPPGRWRHGMTYDASRHRLIVYGGHPSENESQVLADTWMFDGNDWQQLSSASPPGPRFALRLAYDEARDRVVLFGDGPSAEGVTWEFDGTNWLAMPTPLMPTPTRCWESLAYDSKRRVTWLFGGRGCNDNEYSNDTWAYGPDPDGDGIVGGLDNCPNVANANQANGDGDPAGDACDCAPTDPTAWAVPQPVTALLASGSGTTSLTWDDQAPTIGIGAQYDVATGLLSDLHGTAGFGPATCLASRVGVPSASDGRVPPASDGFYYLVRSRNACGIGSYGAPALDAASPCP